MKRQLRSKIIAALAMATAATLCACSPSSDNSTSDVAAASHAPTVKVSRSTLMNAQNVISGIDYLPFFNWDTGCEYRAQYMGLELAANSIVGNLITVKATAGTTIWPTQLAPTRLPAAPITAEGSWMYHVAVSFNVAGTEEVIDPSLSTTPVTLDQWLALMGSDISSVTIWYSPFTAWKGPMQRRAGDPMDSRVGSFAEMPPMEEGTMLNIAGMMAYKVMQEGDNWTQADKAEAKREHDKLFSRAIELRDILVPKGVMSAAESDSSAVINEENLDQAEEEAPESD